MSAATRERLPGMYYFHRAVQYSAFLVAFDAVGFQGQFTLAPLMEQLGLGAYEYVFVGNELGDTVSFGNKMPDLEAVGEKYGPGIIEKRPDVPPALSIFFLAGMYFHKKRAERIRAQQGTRS